MKKAVFVISTIILLLFATGFTGCDKDDYVEPQKSNLQIAREVSQEIIEAFIDKDEEALYSLLSQDAKEFKLTKEQIQKAFNFIEGKIISYELPNDTGGGGKSVKHGKVMSENMTPWIHIETDLGKTYRIVFQYFLIFENTQNEGVCRIIVSLLDEKKSYVKHTAIGFELD